MHALIASAVGSALEWYDFFIYGTASALVFGELFFPKYDATVGTLAAYATFAVGFIARPFGWRGRAFLRVALVVQPLRHGEPGGHRLDLRGCQTDAGQVPVMQQLHGMTVGTDLGVDLEAALGGREVVGAEDGVEAPVL